VLPAAEDPVDTDPWEHGFDGSQGPAEGDEPAVAEDEAPRRFRRR
jgi:hypothetical protein